MKIILLQDVAKIGRKNQVVDVPDGYARNQLIPKGQAKAATPDNLKVIQHKQHQNAGAEAAVEERFFANKNALKDRVVKIEGLKNDNGHLFAAIKPIQVKEALATMNIEVEEKSINLPEQIKTTGEHEAELVHPKHSFRFKILVG